MGLSTLHVVRLLLVTAALGALTYVALRPRSVWSVVERFLSHESYAFSLGVLRILLFTRLYQVGSRVHVVALAEAPAETRNLPPGWGWLGEMVPLFDRDFATSAQSLFVAAALLAIFGAATRITAPISAIVSAYLIGLPNFFAKIDHGEHLLVCFCLVLAFSRCGDACSVDALVSGARQRRWSLSSTQTRSLAYGLPMRLCWLVMGLAYFFPGLYKAWKAGDQWLPQARWPALRERHALDPVPGVLAFRSGVSYARGRAQPAGIGVRRRALDEDQRKTRGRRVE